jgi:hypothetical protein
MAVHRGLYVPLILVALKWLSITPISAALLGRI